MTVPVALLNSALKYCPEDDKRVFETTHAGGLCADHIGHDIRFVTILDADVIAVIGAELRQVYHVGSSTTLSVCGPESVGDVAEFTLEYDQHVYVFEDQ
jgi:hypothetical protein